MKRIYLLFTFLILTLFSCQKETAQKEQLWYKEPAEKWLEALPLGNGRLGAMVFGKPGEERIQLNEESLWAGCPEDPYPENSREHYARFQELNLEGKYKEALDYGLENLAVSPTSIRSYSRFGDIYLKTDHQDVNDYKRSLDLESGITKVEYSIDGKMYFRESFISEKFNALFYHFYTKDGAPLNCDIRFERETDVKQFVDDQKVIHIDGQLFDDPDGYDDNKGGSGKGGYHMKFSGHVAVMPNEGDVKVNKTTLSLSDAKEFTVVFSGATDYNAAEMNFDRSIDAKKISKKILDKVMAGTYKDIRAAHVKSHSEVYNRVNLQIADMTVDTIPTIERIEAVKAGVNDNYLTQVLFQYGRYLLMASSGGKAVLPANLQGIWNDEKWAAWESDFHLNINLQMNYWPADVCNLSETFDPLSDFMLRLAEKGQVTADKYIETDGWVAHHVSNPFGRTTPSGSTMESMVNNGYCFPLAGAWMSLSLWRHYEFVQDEEYLSAVVYPVIKGASQFILDFLVENEKGELVTAPSYSPENSYYDPETGEILRNTIAATIDIQVIRDVFDACLKTEKALGKNDMSDAIQEALVKLPEIKIGKDGTIQEWYEDYEDAEPGHRHISHLFGLHPSAQISESKTQELHKAAQKTLEKRLSYGGGQTGWSRAWVVNFYARLFNGDECNKHINALFEEHITPNLFDLHPPRIFQIDGNLGITAGIAEMLIQSHEENTIRLLPALPSAWNTGKVTGLKARGAYEVDMYWEEGKLIKAVVKANKGGNPEVMYDEMIVRLDLAAGESVEVRF